MDQVLALMREAASRMTGAACPAVSRKGRGNFVTQADLAVQEFLRGALQERFPDYGFFSEEQENQADFSRPVWILDPIDGTANFVAGYGHSAISLALYQEGAVSFGAVYNPFSGEMFHAGRGKGAFCNGAPIRAEHGAALPDALIELGTMPYYKDRAAEVGRLTEELLLAAGDIRRGGSAALAFCYTAAGRTGAMLEGLLQPWDYAAGLLIAEEAGAETGDWAGRPLDPRKQSAVLAADKRIFAEVLAIIQKIRKE